MKVLLTDFETPEEYSIAFEFRTLAPTIGSVNDVAECSGVSAVKLNLTSIFVAAGLVEVLVDEGLH